jgi:hypothetical protein
MDPTHQPNEIEPKKYPHTRWELLKKYPTLGAALQEIEKLQTIGDMMTNAINQLLGDNEPTEDLEELLTQWKNHRA